jgi:N-acetylglucosaminyldiphosphoundecaprenol N-acetyl-beta-D-mannosaminyltransferase
MYPGFGTVEEMSTAATIEEINRCAPDFLVVALGAKKGQAWLQRNQNRLKAPVISHLGAVVNMAAGTIARAPLWMQKCGLEWAWRIMEEPPLWRRYLNDGLILAKLLMFRALPSYIYTKRRPQSVLFHSSTATLRRTPDTCFIDLTGPWEHANLGPLRQAMSEATLTPCDVVITVYDVVYVDSAFLGCSLLLYGHQLKLGRTLRFEGATAGLERIFDANCVAYLMA